MNNETFSFGSDVKVESGFTPMPAGWYNTCITDAIYKPTKANNGEYLSVTFSVIGEEYAGRKVFNMYNLVNKNPKAVEIAMTQMKSLLIETGCDESKLLNLSKSALVELLLNRNVGIKVKIQISEEYGDKNVIVGYKMTSNPTMPMPILF